MTGGAVRAPPVAPSAVDTEPHRPSAPARPRGARLVVAGVLVSILVAGPGTTPVDPAGIDDAQVTDARDGGGRR